MVGKKLFLVLALFLALSFSLSGEVESSVKITALTGLSKAGDNAAFSGAAEASLDLKSVGNKNVKGFFQLDAIIANGYTVDIPRAYIKVRFPWFRTILGKTRVSWGEGFLFNAGDVIFGGIDLSIADFSADVLRDETDWLWELYLPLGRFSYLEAVLFPYLGETGELETNLEDLFAKSSVDIDELAAGGRAVTKLLGIKCEGGYLYHAPSKSHRPYLSFEGHLLVDWNLSASLGIPQSDNGDDDFIEWMALSAGFFHLMNLSKGGTLCFRLEAGISPGGEWEEVEGGLTESTPVYGINLFPEIVYFPADTLALQLRSLVSPIDLSALILAGINWNVYQGLTVISYLSLMTGDEDDLYSWSGDAGISWTAGLEFIY